MVAFVVAERISVREKPDREAGTVVMLQRNDSIEIARVRVPDSFNKQAFWYAVRTKAGLGFIPYEDETLRNYISSFAPVQTEEYGMVMASSLRLRSAPTLFAPVITALPRQTIVRIEKKGSLYQVIDGLNQRWYQVVSPRGERGFVFAGYLHEGSKQALSALAAGKYQEISGWVRIVGKPEYLDDDAATPVDRVTSAHPCGKEALPDVGEYAQATATRVEKGRVLYRVQKWYGDFDCTRTRTAYLAGGASELITDFYKHSLGQAPASIPTEMLQEINRELKGNLNAATVKARKVQLREGATYYQVDAHAGPAPDPDHPLTVFFVMEDEGRFTTVARMLDAGSERPERFGIVVVDLDKDGTAEIVHRADGRGEMRASLYALRGSRYERVDGLGTTTNVALRPPFVVVGSRVYRFKGGALVEANAREAGLTAKQMERAYDIPDQL